MSNDTFQADSLIISQRAMWFPIYISDLKSLFDFNLVVMIIIYGQFSISRNIHN